MPSMEKINLPPNEPAFIDIHTCFTTITGISCDYIPLKTQRIVLFNRGIHPYILDVYQPPITVSEWYSCDFDHPASYHIKVDLLGDQKNSIDFFEFCDIVETEEKLNCWQQVTHVFKNYGPGARSIIFQHGTRNLIWREGKQGCYITGAYVSVNTPKNICISTANANK